VSLGVVAFLYAMLAAVAAGLAPGWVLALAVALLVPRWMIAVHELFHLRSEREVDPLTRLQLLLFTPLALGYREMLANHRSHHRATGTLQDAEHYQLTGPPWQGFLNALSAPEQMWFRWVGEHGIDSELARGTALRAALFAVLVVGTRGALLWYWLPARIVFGLSYFVFFYCLHRRGEAFGSYALPLREGVSRALKIVYGTDVVEATVHHDVHHAQPRIAARDLGAARAALVQRAPAGHGGATDARDALARGR
jgi:fatty acid desaturase